jgi:hypothetical protein
MLTHLNPARHGSLVAAIAIAAMLTGCQPGANNGVNLGGDTTIPGDNNAGPIVNFITPRQSFDIADDEEKTVQYRVTAAGPTSVKIFLDVDLNVDNGNEMDLSPLRQLADADATDEVPLVASRYPYGTYWVRAVVDDGTTQSSFIAPGNVRIIPSDLSDGEDPTDVDLTGLQIVYDSGEPVPVNGQVPFADLWHELDVLDNLAPRVITPIEITEKVEIHMIRAFTFGHSDPTPRRVDIYKGTNQDGPGELIHRVDVSTATRFAGKWTAIRLDEPITLEPGQYGISYHARFEFTERVAANAPNGEGYVWVSAFGAAPFVKAGAEAFGFDPNFAIRVLGKYESAKADSARTRVPPVLPDTQRLIYRSGAERVVFNADEDVTRELNPLHVVWREVTPKQDAAE